MIRRTPLKKRPRSAKASWRNPERVRLDAKIRVYQEAVDQAQLYRPQVTDRERIHRLEAWIDETALQIQGMRDEL